MANMDGKIVDTAEKMIRRLYNLSDSYVVTSYNVKPSNIEMAMANELISLKVKIPTSVVEENLWMNQEIEEEQDEEIDDNNEEPKDDEEAPKSVKNIRKAPSRK